MMGNSVDERRKGEYLMKALVYEGIKNIKVKEVEDAKLRKPDDILIKVTSTAICGSDLHLYHGMIPNMPKNFILGHETMGMIEEAGPEVTRLKKGDRVIVPFPIACGHCQYCEQGDWSQCDRSNAYGEIGAIFGYSNTLGGYDGGQAEYLRVPYANVGPVVVPEELTDEQALFLTDVLPTAYWGVEAGGVKPQDTVVVLGCGPIGLTAVKWSFFAGAKRVIAVDYIDYRLKHAAGYGAETVHFENYDDTGEYLHEITHGGADVVLDCVGMDGKTSNIEKLEAMLKLQGGSKSAIEMAARAVRKCGTVVFIGVYGTRYNLFPLGDFYSRNITLKMGQCPVHRYVEPIMKLVMEDKFEPTDIITHKLPLKEGAEAYQMFDKKQDSCIKVILKP